MSASNATLSFFLTSLFTFLLVLARTGQYLRDKRCNAQSGRKKLFYSETSIKQTPQLSGHPLLSGH